MFKGKIRIYGSVWFLALGLWLLLTSASYAADFGPEIKNLAGEMLHVYSLPENEQAEAFRPLLKRGSDLAHEMASHSEDVQRLLDQALDTPALNFSQAQRANIKAMVRNTVLIATTDTAANYAVGHVSTERLKSMIDTGGQFLSSISISSQPGFQRILDEKNGVKIEDPQMRKLAQEYLPKFFDALPLRLKSRMISGVLRLPAGASTAEQTAAVLLNAGPLTQKLFQFIGRKTTSPEMEEVMGRLQSDITPIPRDTIMKVLYERLGKKKMEEFLGEVSGPKASGSVGQVHFSTAKGTGQEVVIKVRRPGVLEDFEDEAGALKKVTAGSEFGTYSEKVVSNIGRELDFRDEAKNLEEGAVYIDPKKGLGIAKLVRGVEPTEDVLVIEKAPGKKISDYVKPAELVQRGKAVSNLLEAWFKNSVLKEGFFHGDLHPGNIFLKLPAVGEKGKALTTLIDFGNTGRITHVQQKAFVQLMAALTFRSPQDVVTAISRIGPVRAGEEALFKADVEKTLANKPVAPLDTWFKDRIDEVMKSAVAHGADIPADFLNFARGKAFLEIEISEVNEKLDQLDKEKKLPRFDPLRPEIKALVRETPNAIKDSALGKNEGPVSIETIKNVLQAWKNSPYSGNIRGFCKDYFSSIVKEPEPGNLPALSDDIQ